VDDKEPPIDDSSVPDLRRRGDAVVSDTVDAVVASVDAMKIKMAGFTDEGYLPIAAKWYRHMSELGYNEHLIVATNERMYSALRQKGYRTELWHVDFVHPLHGNHTNQFLWKRRFEYALEQVRAGRSVFLSDVDNIYGRYVPLRQFEQPQQSLPQRELQQPKRKDKNQMRQQRAQREQQQQSSLHYDVYHAYGTKYPRDVHNETGFVVTAGFAYYKGNAKVARMLEEVLTRCEHRNGNDKHEDDAGAVTECDDQAVLNRYYLRNVRWDEKRTGQSELYSRGGRAGYHAEIGIRIFVWPRSFAWRGWMPKRPEDCPPAGWWASMPIAKKQAEEKESMFESWNHVCGFGGGRDPAQPNTLSNAQPS